MNVASDSTTRTRWAGIDEAGYGPNLGPLVMTAVVAEAPAGRPPDLWNDLSDTVCRAKGPPDRLWVDDSKAILKGGRGLARLEAAALAALAACGRPSPGTLDELLGLLGAGDLGAVELDRWTSAAIPVPRPEAAPFVDRSLALRPFGPAPWTLTGARTVVTGPRRFNALLGPAGSKALVHFDAFRTLLGWLWDLAADGVETVVRGDKHGGRHFYFDLLTDAFPGIWIDRGVEGPDLSVYTLRDGRRRLRLELRPRADAGDGFVALASIISKLAREYWMGAFNGYWTARIPGLKPTAGYPVDALRFREAIEPSCRDLGLMPDDWWRAR